MPSQKQRQFTSSVAIWRNRIFPFLGVFVATFLLVALQWPANSPGVRATASVDFCLPHNVDSLSQTEIENFKRVVGNQVSSQLSGQNFESLIWQTKRTGEIVSSAIEYFDHETISENIGLGFTFQPDCGQLLIEYVCEGEPDQIRFLQLVAQQVATSIDNLILSMDNGVVFDSKLDIQKFDRAIWLANQIQADLGEIRTRGATHDQASIESKNPYAFASARRISSDSMPSELPNTSGNHINSIDANSLLSVLDEIKTQATSPDLNDATFSVLKVNLIRSEAINATPDRLAIVGMIMLAGVVTGLVAVFHSVSIPSTSVQELSQSLGIPVVAVLPTVAETNQTNASGGITSTLAKSIMVASKMFLVVVTVVVIGFVILDSSIRMSFFQNPFDGLAKIFAVFTGHS